MAAAAVAVAAAETESGLTRPVAGTPNLGAAYEVLAGSNGLLAMPCEACLPALVVHETPFAVNFYPWIVFLARLAFRHAHRLLRHPCNISIN
ncbi:hypothetical protein Nepgr_012679 [Nepenthes gracilis]|uniref:Uncharacterized protein n=1 Tax=Nepenthes gracilis TaxID=150966 RepID=A0AAD3SGF5_NEPGR|nr:hypothetical protein Nepgr_012679 [Nepenthes gracilis]